MDAGITRITPDPLFFSMKKLIRRIEIMHIRCCGFGMKPHKKVHSLFTRRISAYQQSA